MDEIWVYILLLVIIGLCWALIYQIVKNNQFLEELK